MLAHSYLTSIKIPESILIKARSIFSKYKAEDLRDASYDYMRMYQLLHANESPNTILEIHKNRPFESSSTFEPSIN